MKKLLAILNSQYFLGGVIALSVLVILVGVVLVKNANEKAVIYVQEQAIAQKKLDDQKVLDQMTSIADQAQAELQATQSTTSGTPQDLNFSTEESQQKIDKMVNKNPAQGSEDWCEVMMVKPNKEWTKEEQGVFAKHCLK